MVSVSVHIVPLWKQKKILPLLYLTKLVKDPFQLIIAVKQGTQTIKAKTFTDMSFPVIPYID